MPSGTTASRNANSAVRVQSPITDLIFVTDYRWTNKRPDGSSMTGFEDEGNYEWPPHTQAWYDSLKPIMDKQLWYQSKRKLPLAEEMGDALFHETVGSLQAAVKSEWPSILRAAGLAGRPYEERYQITVDVDDDLPVRQVPGEDPDKVDVNLSFTFTIHMDMSHRTPSKTGRLFTKRKTKIEHTAQNITFPTCHTMPSATRQALQEFLDGDWLPSGVADCHKGFMRHRASEEVKVFSASELYMLEDEFRRVNNLGDGHLAQVTAQFSLDENDPEAKPGECTLIASYRGRDYQLSQRLKWQPLKPIHAAVCRLPATSQGCVSGMEKDKPELEQDWVCLDSADVTTDSGEA